MTKPIKYEAFLKLETGTHTARVNHMLATPDGKALITAGEDKTIRVWDVESKKQISMLLGQIGPGSDGSIQAIALTPDGKYVVVLAWMNPEGKYNADDRETDVRVYDLATGNLQAGFRYPGTLQDLDFSPDGRQLAIVGNPKAANRCGYVLIYETRNILKGFGRAPRLLASDVLYDNDTLIPSYVRFVPDKKARSAGSRIVVATWIHHKGEDPEYTGKLIWYSHTPSSRLKRTGEHEIEEQCAPISLAVSREFVITTGDQKNLKKFFCHDHAGNLKAAIPSESLPARPAFSKDETQLIVGQRGDSALVQVKVYAVSFGQFQLKSTYYGHDSEAVAVALLPDGTAVSAGGDQNAIHFWSTSHMEGEQIGEISGVGRVVHAVGINSAEQIGLGNHDDLRHEDGSIVLQRLFDLRSMTLRPSSLQDESSYRRAQKQFGDRELKWMELWGYLNLFLLPDTIPFTGVPPVGWYIPSTFGFTENGTVVTGASDGKVRVAPHNADGNYDTPVRLLVGHAARVIDHAASGKWLVTAGADQIIRLWYMDDVDENVMTDLQPALNLFTGADDEWVIWSKSGYYNASQRGDRRFGYHVNRGSDLEALYYPSDRFIKSFFRPDIIHAIVETGSEKAAVKKLAEQGIATPRIDVPQILPPIVELAENGVTATREDVTFAFTVTALNHDKPVTRIWIVHNEQFVWESQKRTSRYKVTLPLIPGKNSFKILAETESTKSMPVIQVIWGPESGTARKGQNKKGSLPKHLESSGTARGGATEAARFQENTVLDEQEQGNLYVLAVGVSTLKNETDDFKSLTYADDDAISIYNAFGRSIFSSNLKKRGALKNRAFKSVEATILVNETATKAAILEAVDKICEKIRKRGETHKSQRDGLLVFLSGHGIRRKDDFERELYFWCYDLLKSSTRATGLSFIELGQKITSLPADVILATDACHSGMAGSDMVRGLDPNELAKRLYAINERGLYILNASRSEELAREHGKIGHGVFTKAILEALEFESDHTMMNLMASVQRRVLYYTGHLQTPVFRMYGDLLPLTIYEK